MASPAQSTQEHLEVFPTPDIRNMEVVEIAQSKLNSQRYPEGIGKPHPNTRLFPAHRLTVQEPMEDKPGWIRRVYATDRIGQDDYNYSIKFSAESNDHPIYLRAYLTPRKNYSPLAKLSIDPLFPGTDALPCVLVAEEMRDSEEPNVKNLYVVAARAYETLPGPWLPFTRYDDNLGPIQGRRRAVVNTGQTASLTSTGKTTYEAREGSSYVSWEIEEIYSDGTGGAVNPAYPIGVSDIYDEARGPVQTTTQLVVKTGIEAGTLIESGGVITETEFVPFNEFLLQRSVEVWDVATALAKVTDVYDETRGPVRQTVTLIVKVGNEAGTLTETAGVITETKYSPLNDKVLQRSVEVWTAPGVLLVDSATNAERQVVTKTRQLKKASGYTAPSPSAIKEVIAEQINAVTISEQTSEVLLVFDSKQVSAQKPDVIPEAFRASVSSQTTQQRVAGTTATMPTLGTNDLQASEQRISEFVKETSVTVRDNGVLPTLAGQDFDDLTGIAMPYTEAVVAAPGPIGDANKRITPLSDAWALVRSNDEAAIRTALLAVLWQIPGRENISLPDQLISATVIWSTDEGDGTDYQTSGKPTGNASSGYFGPIVSSSAEASAGVGGAISAKIKKGYQGPVPSTYNIFFLDGANVTDAAVLTKVGAVAWPVFRQETEQLIVTGGQKQVRVSQKTQDTVAFYGLKPYSALRILGDGESRRGSIDIRVWDLPPTLHGAINLSEIGIPTATASAICRTSLGETRRADVSIEGTVVPSHLTPTSPAVFPNGKVLVRADVSPYAHGLVRVTAVTVDITSAFTS